MKNLKKFNVSELNNEELTSTEGGWTLLGLWRTYKALGSFNSPYEGDGLNKAPDLNLEA